MSIIHDIKPSVCSMLALNEKLEVTGLPSGIVWKSSQSDIYFYLEILSLFIVLPIILYQNSVAI